LEKTKESLRSRIERVNCDTVARGLAGFELTAVSRLNPPAVFNPTTHYLTSAQ